MLFKNILIVGIGGMIGTILRYLAGYLIRHDSYPYATFVVNILGSFAIGAIMGVAARQEGFGNWRLFLATGICGGFTTFSAFAWENMQFLQQQRYVPFAVYAGSSIILGLAAVTAGYWITK